MRPILLPVLMTCSLLRADALEEVRTALKGLAARNPVRIAVQEEGWEKEGQAPVPYRRAYQVTDGPDGPVLAGAGKAGEHEVSAREVTRAHEALLETLKEAKVLEVRSEPFEGRPARRIRLSIAGEDDPEAKKHLKRFELELVLWVGPDQLPFRAEQRVDLAGRVMLVVSFWTKATDVRTFQRHGDRLLLATRRTEVQGKAAGRELGGQGTLQATLVPAS